MADAPKPARVHLYALRKIDSRDVGGGARVKTGGDFHADAKTADRLVASGHAVAYADRPKNT